MNKTIIIFFIIFIIACTSEPYGEKIVPTEPPTPDYGTCSPDSVYFFDDIRPVLTSSCAIYGCHDANTPAVNIDLSSYEGVMNSKVLDEYIVKPGNPMESKIYRAVKAMDLIFMPPPYNFQITTKAEENIRKWIIQGAKNNRCNITCDTTKIKYQADIKPLIDKYCTGCHFGDYAYGGINTEVYNQIKKLVDDTLLVNALYGKNNTSLMPPDHPLPACEIDRIERWIKEGALRN